MNDTDLMIRVKEGDEDAYRQIVEKYHPQILNLCFKYLNNQEDAEETAQDVFIKLLQYASTYQPTAKLSTYLYRIAVNLSLNKIRDRKWKQLVSWDYLKRKDEKDFTVNDMANPEKLVEQEEKQKAVRSVVDSLPSSQKTAVILQRFQGLSYEEIAEVMNCSISAVEARLHRARQTLKKKLAPLVT